MVKGLPSTTLISKSIESFPVSYTHLQSRDLRNNELNKIVKLIQVIPAHPASLNEDYLQIEALALQTKQEEEFEKWLDGKIDGLYIRIEPEFRDGDFVNKHWVK